MRPRILVQGSYEDGTAAPFRTILREDLQIARDHASVDDEAVCDPRSDSPVPGSARMAQSIEQAVEDEEEKTFSDLLTPTEASHATGFKLTWLAQLFRAEKIDGIKDGWKVLYSLSSILEYQRLTREARQRLMKVQMGAASGESGLPLVVGPPVRAPNAPEPDDLHARAAEFVARAVRNMETMGPGCRFFYRYDSPPFTEDHLEAMARYATEQSNLVVKLDDYVDPAGRRALRAEKPTIAPVSTAGVPAVLTSSSVAPQAEEASRNRAA